MEKKQKINVEGIEIVTFTKNNSDYISLTDIARYKNPLFPADVVKNWMRTRGTIDFLGLWEKLHNPVFKLVEFDQFKNEAGANSFVNYFVFSFCSTQIPAGMTFLFSLYIVYISLALFQYIC